MGINLIIPAAGKGERVKERFPGPKPLFPFQGKAIIQRVIENSTIYFSNMILVLDQKLEELSGIQIIDQSYRGAAHSIWTGLKSFSQKQLDDPLLIRYCDVVCETKLSEKDFLLDSNIHLISSLPRLESSDSFVIVSQSNNVKSIKKNASNLSNEIFSGICYFKSAGSLLYYLDNTSSSLSLIINKMILDGAKATKSFKTSYDLSLAKYGYINLDRS